MLRPWGFAPKNAEAVPDAQLDEEYSSVQPPLYSTLPDAEDIQAIPGCQNIRNFAHALRNFAANAVTRNQNCLHIDLPLSKKAAGMRRAVAVYPALPDCFLPVGRALTQDKPAKS